MAKIDFGKLKGNLRDAADIAANAAKDASKRVKVPDVKLSDIKMPDIKMPKDFSLLKKKTDTDDLAEGSEVATCLSTDSAIQIFYYLMAVDGRVDAEEEESFASIAREMDPDAIDRVGANVDICRK